MTTLPLILNPAAGGGACARKAPAALRRLADAGLTVTRHDTTGPGHATALATQLAAKGHRTILCAGGDGTTYEVLNGLLPWTGEGRPALGLLPLGTGNSFLKDFGVRNADEALAAVLSGRRTPVDAVRIEHAGGALHFANLLSLGFVSKAGATTNRWFKPLGPAGYAVATVIEVARLQHVVLPIRLDGGETDARPCVFLSFNNSRCTGGDMQMAPDADPTDGRLDVVRVGPLGRLDLLRTFPAIYDGKHLDHPLNEATTAVRVDLDLPGPVDCMIDGEVIRLHVHALEVVPAAWELLGP